MKDTDKALLFRELAKLLKADFHLDRSIALLLGQNPKPAVAALLRELQEGLKAGAGVSEAMRRASAGGLTTLDLALAGAGEQSGRLAQSFDLLARYYESLTESLRKARGALIYPLVLAHLGIILPEIPAAIASGDAAALPLRLLTRLALLWLVLALIFKGWSVLSRRAETLAGLDRLLGAVPLLGAMRAHWALARFTRVAHSGLLAALRPQEWLRLAGEASGSGQFQAGAARAANRVAEGQPIAASLRDAGGFPKLFVDSLDTAEEAGALDHEMARWAELEAAQAGESMDRVAAWLPKLLYAAIALYIAWRIISMITGIYAPLLRETGVL